MELFDPYDAATQADPYPVYRRLRDEHPVYRNPERGFLALSRFEDVMNAVHDPARFSSADGISLEGQARPPFPLLITMDPPRHDRLRGLISRGFTARPMAAYEPRVRESARELFEAFETSGSCDLVASVAAPLPMRVIGDLVGVDAADRPQFVEWSDHVVHQDLNDPESIQAARDANANLVASFGALLEARRREPKEDLVSALLAAEVDGERLTETELVGFIFLLIVAGSETTTNLIGHTAAVLARHPDQRALLLEDPAKVPGAIEELLRFESPVHGLARTLTGDVELHGVTMRRGERVQLLYGSANRDEREFADPDRFDVTRKIERHLAFAHGIHYCLGAALARLEGRVVLEELLARIPDWQLASDGPVEMVRSSSVRGPARLPIEFTPAGAVHA